MAFSALLRRGGTTAALTIRDEWKPLSLKGEVIIVGGEGTADPVKVSGSYGAPAEMALPIRLGPYSDYATMVADMDALNLFIAGGACTLEITFSHATTPTIWNVTHGHFVTPDYTRTLDLAYWANTDLIVVASPFTVASAATTDLNATSYTFPSATTHLDLPTTALKVPYNIKVDGTSDLHAFWVAVDATKYTDNYSFLVNGTALTGLGTNVTDATNSYSGTYVKVETTSYDTGVLTVTGYPEGPYLLLARVKATAGTGTIMTDYTSEVTFTNTSFNIIPLGFLYLPPKAVIGAGASTVTISMKISSTSNDACLDWVFPLPIANGYLSYHNSSTDAGVDYVQRDAATGRTYIDGVCNEADVTGNTIMARTGNLIIVTEAKTHTKTHATAITVSHVDRYATQR